MTDPLAVLATEVAVTREGRTTKQVRGNVVRKTVASVEGAIVTATDGTKAARTRGFPIAPGDEIYFENATGNPQKPGWFTSGAIGDDSDFTNLVARVDVAEDELDIERALRFDVADYGAERGTGKSGTVRTANTAAIQAAATAATNAGGTLVIKGVYEVGTSTITAGCHIDARDGHLYVFAATANPVLRCGATESQISHRRLILPSVRQQAKISGDGWAGADCGIELANLYGCEVTIPYVVGFQTGVRVAGHDAACVSNIITIGRIASCKVGLRLVVISGSGSVNDNMIHGPRFTQDPADGSAVAGASAILAGADVDGNTFIGAVFPGNQPQYTVELAGGANLFLRCRWNGSPPTLRLVGAGAHSNVVLYGSNASGIVVSLTGGATAAGLHILTRDGLRLAGDGSSGSIVAANATSDSSPVYVVMPSTYLPSTAPASDWVVRQTAQSTQFKGTADAASRLQIDHTTGSVTWEGDTTLYRNAANELKTDDRLLAASGIGVGNTAAASTPGAVIRRMPIYDANGTLLGYLPIYDAIT